MCNGQKCPLASMAMDIADIVVAHSFCYSLSSKGVFLCFWFRIVRQFFSISQPIGCTNSDDICCQCHLVICGILLVVVVVAYLSAKVA